VKEATSTKEVRLNPWHSQPELQIESKRQKSTAGDNPEPNRPETRMPYVMLVILKRRGSTFESPINEKFDILTALGFLSAISPYYL